VKPLAGGVFKLEPGQWGGHEKKPDRSHRDHFGFLFALIPLGFLAAISLFQLFHNVPEAKSARSDTLRRGDPRRSRGHSGRRRCAASARLAMVRRS